MPDGSVDYARFRTLLLPVCFHGRDLVLEPRIKKPVTL
jgi:hypothetical protein